MIYVVEKSTLEPYEDWSTTRLFDNKRQAITAYTNGVRAAYLDAAENGFGEALYLIEVASGQSPHEGRVLSKTYVRGHGKNMNYSDQH